jgi:hypothetical protein
VKGDPKIGWKQGDFTENSTRYHILQPILMLNNSPGDFTENSTRYHILQPILMMNNLSSFMGGVCEDCSSTVHPLDASVPTRLILMYKRPFPSVAMQHWAWPCATAWTSQVHRNLSKTPVCNNKDLSEQSLNGSHLTSHHLCENDSRDLS